MPSANEVGLHYMNPDDLIYLVHLLQLFKGNQGLKNQFTQDFPRNITQKIPVDFEHLCVFLVNTNIQFIIMEFKHKIL